MEIQEIKSRLTLKEVLQHYGLKPDKHLRLHCPFHADKTPSLQVYYKTQSCYCFSSNCSTNGKSLDVIDFIMHMEKLTKHEAIVKAKEMITGVSSPATALTKSAVLLKMFTYFKNAIHNSKPAKEYLQSRNLDHSQVEIGYNSGQFHHGSRKDEALIQSCLKYGLLLDKGHVNNRTGEKAYSPFGKNCISFALRNGQSQITGLYFRSITDNNKSRHFYLKDRKGLYPHYPKPETKRLILTESIIDAASLLQSDRITKDTGVLALYGTNGLTEEHTAAIQSLKHLEEIVFMLNGDEPGKKAVIKHSEALHQLLPPITISNAAPPEGEDINSLLQGHEPGILEHLIAERTFLFSVEKKKEQTPEIAQPPVTTGKLDTSNPEYITFSKGNLFISVLGGIGLLPVDKLKVTLKIERSDSPSPLHSLRHTLDLYYSDQSEKLTRKAAERLEVGSKDMQLAIAELTQALENYRLEQLEAQKPKKPEKRILTAEQEQAAIKFLKRKDLLATTDKLIEQSGVVGEKINRQILWYVYTSRLREQPLHVICLGASGTGKTYLQERVTDLIPEEDKVSGTAISENALYYAQDLKLPHKLFIIEDLDGATNVLYSLRELQTKSSISKIVTNKDSKGNLKTIVVEVHGPICLTGTTTKERLYEDNANRCLLIYLDGSKQQHEAIMNNQRKRSAGKINKQQVAQTREFLRDVQSVLKPIAVRNPYAEQLHIPDTVFKPLRTNAHYLAFIEAITFYCQYQRKVKTDQQTGEQYIETTLEDIAAANALLKDVLLAKSDELTKACRDFFETIKSHLQREQKTSFYNQDIRAFMRINPHNLKYYLKQLVQYGYLKVIGGNRYKQGLEYEITDQEEYQNLNGTLTNALDQALEKLKKQRG